MTIGYKHFLIGTALVALSATPALSQSVSESWRTDGFSQPESVSYDPESGDLFVSNINSPDMSANGEGYISRLGTDGEMIEAEFVTGLNAPKGTMIDDGTLYVAGVEELVAIDIESGEITERYAAQGATFLNDVTVSDDGTVYVTETMQGAIYRLEDGALNAWLTDNADLAGANGLIDDGGSLYVATMGDMSGGFEDLEPSNVKAVDIESMAVSDFGSDAPIGALDGIELFQDGVMVTANSQGMLVAVAEDGTITELGDVGSGAADHEYVPENNMVVIPMLQGNTVVAWTVSQ